jgi:hypothetical protein
MAMNDWVNFRRIEEEKLDEEQITKLVELSKEWAVSQIPGLDYAYKLNKQRNEYLKKRKEIIETQKLMEFHDRLVKNGLTEEEMLKYSPSQDVVNEYYSILNQVCEDEDTDKIECYVKLLKRFVNKPPLVPGMKKELLKLFRELSRENIEMLLTFNHFVKQVNKESAETFSMHPQTVLFHEYISNARKDTLLKTSLNHLITLGLIEQDGSLPPKLSPLASVVLKIIE